jgi:hypothetical protein
LFVEDTMSRSFVVVLCVGLLPSIAWATEGAIQFDAGSLRITLSATGQVQSLYDVVDKKEYLVAGQPAPLLTLVMDGKAVSPTAATYSPAANQLKLAYGAGISATVGVAVKPTHLRLELKTIEGATPTRVYWGPLPTTIDQSIGEVIAVVRGDKFAIGVQSLGIQTTAGAMGNVPETHLEDREHLSPSTGKGSRLFATAIEHDGRVKGSSIALFGCPRAKALETIGQIELAEGLPHPMLDGVWGKISPTAKLSYLIVPFGEDTIDEACRYAEQAGLTTVYHPNPFESWGHFKLTSSFPRGDASMKRCVEKAAKRGIRLGLHTLSGFIQTNDPYVTPIPDPRLARSGSSTLAAAVDERTDELAVKESEPFTRRTPYDTPMNTVVLGQELVRYEKVSERAPWRLLGCQRGAFGTKASAHPAGADVGHLADHNYRTFYPGIENGLMDEMTARLVELFNNTGVRQMSFDGLEGVSCYGYGEYAGNRFVKQCYGGWKLEVVTDASRLLHYLWHINTRMNWGEPWGLAMREGQVTNRFENQAFFERNLLPPMLGWFQVRTATDDLEATTLDDIEWALAKAAGFDAGFAITADDLKTLKTNAQASAILAAVRLWEKARFSGTLSDQQRQKLRAGEFHLESAKDGRLLLTPASFASSSVPAFGEERETEARLQVENAYGQQPLRFILRVQRSDQESPETAVVNPSIEAGGRRVTFAVNLKPRQYLVYHGDRDAAVCDANWNKLSSVQVDAGPLKLAAGKQPVVFRCQVRGKKAPKLQIKWETRGQPDQL